MRRLLVGVALAAALSSTSAHAQNWTGFYLGANTGVGWGNASSVNQPADPASRLFFQSAFSDFAPGSFDTSFDQNGWVGGFQAGYNWQAGAFVWGVEADIQKSAISGSGSQPAFLSPSVFGSAFPFTVNVQSELQWFGTVRGRVGFLLAPNLLLYGTGGLAYGETQTDARISIGPARAFPLTVAYSNGGHALICTTPANSSSVCYSGSNSEMRVGWTAGGGGEWKLDANWSVKFEYLHIQLAGTSVNLTSPPPSTPGVNTNFGFDDQAYDIVRVGLNSRFN
jgi:outer membrane immunogenic protein